MSAIELPKYRCHKVVEALQIAEILLRGQSQGFPELLFEGGYPALVVREEWLRKHEPKVGGYWIRYADGYESYSPAGAFEEGYRRLAPEEPDTKDQVPDLVRRLLVCQEGLKKIKDHSWDGNSTDRGEVEEAADYMQEIAEETLRRSGSEAPIAQDQVPKKQAFPFPEVVRQTPNVSRDRQGRLVVIAPRGVIFHHTSGNYAGAVNWCLKRESQVSYHAIIAGDGSRTILAEDAQRAWHAGASRFKGMAGCNSFMLGLAFTGDTVTGKDRPGGKPELTEVEMQSALEWLLPRYKRWALTFDWLTDHRTVAPGRKNDLAPRELERLLAFLRPHLAG